LLKLLGVGSADFNSTLMVARELVEHVGDEDDLALDVATASREDG